MKRRSVLRTGVAGLAGLSGCVGGFEKQSAWRDPPLAENRPDAVYVPAVVEGMGTYGTAKTADYAVALTYSYPHRFWLTTGSDLKKVVVKSDDSLHLMASVWERETGTVVPAEVRLTLSRNGETVTTLSPWPMLSQSMGFHYGDNVSLPETGSYTAEISVGGGQFSFAPSLDGQFQRQQSTALDFTFDKGELTDLPIDRQKDRRGDRGAVGLMMKEIPSGRVPPPDALPGTVLGTGRSGDLRFVVGTRGGDASDGSGGANSELYVSPRTPYNRIVVPMMSLSANVTTAGKTLFEGSLTGRVAPDIGFHYGAPIEKLPSGSEVTISVDAPPQVARHDGYETALLSFENVTVST